MSRRRWVAALGAAMLACGSLVLTAGPAQAAPACASAPVPELPGRGVVGFFESRPDPLPPQADPFAPNATTTIHDQYGYAGLRWSTYDLGCGPDLVRSPDAPMGTSVSNWLLTFPKTAVAATGALVSAAFQPDFLGVFDPFVSSVMNTLRRTVFDQWALLVVSALGLLLIWRARRASLASSAGAIGWALLVMVIASVLFRWPLVAGHAADRTVTTTLGAVVGGLNERTQGQGGGAGAEATGLMHDALLYQTWLGGQFGDASSAVARKYGPAIFDAQALTWREADLLRTDPAAGQKLLQDKRTKFEETAAKVKAEDPDAYEYLTGRRSDARVGYALLAGLAALCAVPFLIVAGMLIIGALIIVRLGVMLFPAIATLGLFPTMRSLVTGVGDTVAAAVINSVVFGIGAAVTIRGYGLVLGPDSGLPGWLDILLVLLLSITMWAALRPFRRLTLMVGSANPFADAAGGVGGVGGGVFRSGGRIFSTAAGTFLGRLPLRQRAVEAQPEQALEPVTGRAEANTVLVTAPEPFRAGTGPVVIGTTGPVAVGAFGGAGVAEAMPGLGGRPGAAAGSGGGPGSGAGSGAVTGAVAAGTVVAGSFTAGVVAAAGPGSRPESAPAAPSPAGGPGRPGRPGTGGPAVIPIGANPFAGEVDPPASLPAGSGAADQTGPLRGDLTGAGGARFESGTALPAVPTGVGTWRPRAQPSDRLPDPVELPVVAAEEYEGSGADVVYRPGRRPAREADQEDAYDRGAGRGR